MKTLVIIPAYNEADNIENLIREIRSFGYDYLVINDNSTDNTEEIARSNDFCLLDLSVNVGLAGVTRTGFKFAFDHDYDCVISIDGDGQHPPKYIHKLIALIEGGDDYAIGSRFATAKKPLTMRMIGSRILTTLIWLKTGRKIADPTSGMRALGRKVIAEFSVSMNYYAEPDAVCHLLKKGYKISETQVDMIDRQGGTSYFISPLKSIKFMLAEIISILLIQ